MVLEVVCQLQQGQACVVPGLCVGREHGHNGAHCPELREPHLEALVGGDVREGEGGILLALDVLALSQGDDGLQRPLSVEIGMEFRHL